MPVPVPGPVQDLLPATDAEAAAHRDAEAEALRATIKKLDGQQNAQIRALEDVPEGLAG